MTVKAIQIDQHLLSVKHSPVIAGGLKFKRTGSQTVKVPA
jgi:hypothetical protein